MSRARRKRTYTRKKRAEEGEGQKGRKKLDAEGKGRIKKR